MSVEWYLVVSAIVFCIGISGVIVRRNPLVILLCLELMLNAANLALVAFARMHGTQDGQVFALIGTGLKALDSEGAPYRDGFGTPAAIGRQFLTTYLVAFEIASVLLLIAAVGAVILARRRAGLAPAEEVSVAEMLRGGAAAGVVAEAPPETMLEAGGPPQR